MKRINPFYGLYPNSRKHVKIDNNETENNEISNVDEEDIFLMVPGQEAAAQQPTHQNNENSPDMFSDGEERDTERDTMSMSLNVPNNKSVTENAGTCDRMNKIQNESIEAQKKEIEQLKETLNKLNHRCTLYNKGR